jgi:hypothetical protein
VLQGVTRLQAKKKRSETTKINKQKAAARARPLGWWVRSLTVFH